MKEKDSKASFLSNLKNSKRLPVLGGVAFLAIIIVVAVIFANGNFGKNVVGEKKLQDIVIGDTRITPEQVQQYADLVKNSKGGDDTSFEEDVTTIAVRDLVQNAALKKESTESGIVIQETDIVKNGSDNVLSDEQLSEALTAYRSAPDNVKIPQQNRAYRNLLQTKLISKNSLLIAFVNYDTPYFKTASAEQKAKDYDQILVRLGEVQKLMSSGGSVSDIAQKVDLDLVGGSKGDSQDLTQYRTGYVLTLMNLSDYSSATKFNDQDGPYPVGDASTYLDTSKKLNETLKKAGDVTDVFAAKNGMYMTARLDSTNGGKYGSWDEMTKSYIDQHVKYAGGIMKEYLGLAQDAVIASIDQTVKTVTDPGLETAEAQESCSQRRVTYRIVAFVKDPGSRSGNPVSSVGGARPSISFNGQNRAGDAPCVSNPNVNNGYVQVGNEVYADCLYSQPSWGGGRVINGPTNGYTFWGIRVGYQQGDPWASPEIPAGSRQTTLSYGSGFFEPAWTPSTANAINNTIYIFLIYQPEQSEGNMIYYLDRTSDCAYISGRAFYRYTSGPRSGQSVSVPFTVIGPPTGWTVGPTPSPDPGFGGTRFAFKIDLGGSRPTGQQIWGNLPGERAFVIQARVPADSGTANAGNLMGKWQNIYAPGCGTPAPPTISASIDCFGVTINNVYDQNAADLTRGTPYFARVYYRNADGSRGPLAIQTNGSEAFASGSANGGPIRHAMSFAPLAGYNNGFIVEASADNISPQGYTDGSVSTTASVGQCWAATCEVTALNPNLGRPGAVEAGRPYNISFNIRNTGQLPLPASAIKVAYDYPTGNRNLLNSSSSGNIPSGGTAFVSSGPGGIAAPNSISSYGMYPYFNNFFAIGGICATINTYEQFQIQPNAELVEMGPDDESPTRIAFSSNARKATPPSGPSSVPGITINRSIIRKDNGSAVANFTPAVNQTLNTDGMAFGPLRPAPWQDTYTGPIDPALEYCGRITVSPAAGWHGPGGDIIATDPDEASVTSCVNILDKPYVKTFGGDVVAGAVFPGADGSCDVSLNSDIKANMRPFAEGKKGAGTQLAAMAPGSVNGFFSASLRGAAPIAPTGLTTISGATGGGTPLSPYWGGNYEANKCLKDYFTTQRVTSDSDDLQASGSMNNNSLDLNILETNKQTLFSGRNVTTAGAVDLGNKRHSMFVDGDVYIAGNITSNTTFNGNPANVGSFRLFVKGNIYIDRAVTQLDGMFVAQPIADGSKGKIFTCSSGMGAPVSNSNQRFTDCGNQLTVFGSFVANEVILGRVTNSIRDSLTQEDFVGPNKSRAAEVFVFTPEVYYANSATRPSSRPTTGNYQYIATLPPIL